MKLFPLFATALALSLLASGCSVFKKSGTTVTNSSTVKTTPVKQGGNTISNYDESQIAPLLGCWAGTTSNYL